MSLVPAPLHELKPATCHYPFHSGFLISTSIRASHAIFDAPLKGTSTLFFKAQASILVALAGQRALLAGFVSASLRIRQVVLGRCSVPISAILDIRGP